MRQTLPCGEASVNPQKSRIFTKAFRWISTLTGNPPEICHSKSWCDKAFRSRPRKRQLDSPKQRYTHPPWRHLWVNATHDAATIENNGVIEMMLGSLGATDSLTIDSIARRPAATRPDRRPCDAWTPGASDPLSDSKPYWASWAPNLTQVTPISSTWQQAPSRLSPLSR